MSAGEDRDAVDGGLDGITTVPHDGVATSARVHGELRLGEGAGLAQGAVVRSTRRRTDTDRDGDAPVTIAGGSAVLENSAVVGWDEAPVRVGRRTVFGHRCVVVGATIGDLGEIGNGSIILEGAVIGDRCMLGEGTLIAAGQVVPDDSVVVGRPGRRIRSLSGADVDRLRALRGGDLAVTDLPLHPVRPHQIPEGPMGALYEYRGVAPTVDPSAVVFDSAEITGDVHIGAGSIIGSGVRIIGDSHGPVRIGAGVQILENAVLHLLPDNELVIEDDVIIGPAAMIHGCRLGAGTVVEPAATVCDWAVVGAGSVVRAGALVRQRDEHPPGSILDGFPAKVVGTVEGRRPARPGWALAPEDLASLRRVPSARDR